MFERISGAVFGAYDRCYLGYYGLNREKARAGNLILFHLGKHRGRALTLSDGTRVLRGDPIIVIHINQVRAREVQRRFGHTALAGVRLEDDFKKSLRLLAREIRENPINWGVRAVTGNTIHGPAAKHFGFDARPDDGMGVVRRWLGLANARALILRTRKARRGYAEKVVNLKNRILFVIWMSTGKLLSLYPPPTA